MDRVKFYSVNDWAGGYQLKKAEKIINNFDKNNENLKASKEYKVNLICKNYGEIFDARDRINKFYITNFENGQ